MLKIVKIGGNIVDNPAKLQAFLADFAALDGDKILVHGGGKVATAISAALGIETVMIEGRRVTDARTLEVVTMVYNGINKQIVSALQAIGCNAVGLCGADGRLITSKRRAPEPIDYGMVGDPVGMNVEFARSLMDQGLTLVIAPITLDEKMAQAAGDGAAAENPPLRHDSTGGAGLLNTNADTVAQTIAVAMAQAQPIGAKNADKENEENGTNEEGVELIYCFEKQGVLADVNDDGSVIPRIDHAGFAGLKAARTVHSGMLPKLENAFRALEKGVGRVVICAAENIAKPGYGGTTIVK